MNSLSLRLITSKISFLLGSVVIVFVCSILIISSLELVFGYPISAVPVWLSGLIGILFLSWAGYRDFRSDEKRFAYFLLILSFLLLMFAASFFISSKFYDISWDGLWYHSSAMIQLLNGWNPFRQVLNEGVIGAPELTYYAKGSWIVSAALYKVTGNIELGKSINLLLFFSSFFLVTSSLLSFDWVTLPTALVMGGILALNPVVICQALTFYVDGQLASLMTILTALLLMITQKSGRIIYLVLGATLILLFNIKLAAIGYVAILCGGFFLWNTFFRKQNWQPLFWTGIISVLIGVVFAGYNPFIRNTLDNTWGNALVTANMDNQTPISLRDKNQIEKLALALFSESSAELDVVKLKWPFVVYPRELKALRATDARIGGFGPLFGGIFLLALCIFLYGLYLHRKNSKHIFQDGFLVIALLLFISIFINPGIWWARFVPQLWILPVFSVMFFINSPGAHKYIKTAFVSMLIIGMGINCFLVAQAQVKFQYEMNQNLKKQLVYLRERPIPIQINFNSFSGNKLRLDALGIKYTEVPHLSCANPTYLYTVTTSYYCK